MATVGEGVVPISADFGPFEKDLNKAEKGIGAKMAGIGKKAAVAFAAVGAAAAAGAVKSITAFTGFERQMNEVFTLLPGITQDAMDDMSGQVKDFSKEFGVLPDKVVPALYQALSAGVPKDNVFEFMETAQMAAKGGVTELTTAVDGITSTVNAYGAETLNATQASDLMFTAVRLGKTNFEELSQSLFQVNPTAAALGVNFGDVTAALAAMTAQGVPTSVATTQLRQLFVELSKEGGATSDVFKEIAGKSFKDFVAAGGDTQEALQLLEKHAKDSGVGINDLFGSVEAGGAALALTGGGTEAFSNALSEMGDSAGATEAAFDQMNQGLGPIFDRIKANLAVFFIDVGQRLAPIVEGALNAVGDAFKVIGPIVSQVIGILFRGDFKGGPFSEDSWFVDKLFDAREAFERIVGIAKQAFGILFKGDFTGGPLAEDSGFVDTLFDIRDALIRIGGMARQAFDILFRGDFTGGPFAEDSPFVDALFTIRETISSIVERLGGAGAVIKTFGAALGGLLVAKAVVVLIGALGAVFSILMGAVTALVGVLASPIVILAAVGAALYLAYQNFDFFRSAVDSVARFLTDTAWPKIQQFARFIVNAFADLVGWVQQHWGAIREAIGHVINVVKGVIGVFVDVISALWRAWGDDLMRIAKTMWDYIAKTVENAIKFVQGIIQTVLAVINGDWGRAWDGIKQMLAAVWDQMRNIVSTVFDVIKSLIGGALSTIGQLWSGAWDHIRDFLGRTWDSIMSALSAALDTVVQWFRELPGRVINAVKEGVQKLLDLGKWIVGKAKEGVVFAVEAAGGLMEWFKGLPKRLADWAMEGAGKLVQLGKDLIQKIIDGITSAPGKIKDAITGLIPDISLPNPFGDGPGRAAAPTGGGSALRRVRSALTPGTYVTSTYRDAATNRRVGGSPTSYHMDRNNPAVDIGGSTAALDRLAPKLRAMGGWREFLWRVKGHYDHIHVAHSGGYVTPTGIDRLRSDELLTKLQVGETVLPKDFAGAGQQTVRLDDDQIRQLGRVMVQMSRAS